MLFTPLRPTKPLGLFTGASAARSIPQARGELRPLASAMQDRVIEELAGSPSPRFAEDEDSPPPHQDDDQPHHHRSEETTRLRVASTTNGVLMNGHPASTAARQLHFDDCATDEFGNLTTSVTADEGIIYEEEESSGAQPSPARTVDDDVDAREAGSNSFHQLLTRITDRFAQFHSASLRVLDVGVEGVRRSINQTLMVTQAVMWAAVFVAFWLSITWYEALGCAIFCFLVYAIYADVARLRPSLERDYHLRGEDPRFKMDVMERWLEWAFETSR